MATQSQLTAFFIAASCKFDVSKDDLEQLLTEIIGPKSIDDCTSIKQLTNLYSQEELCDWMKGQSIDEWNNSTLEKKTKYQLARDIITNYETESDSDSDSESDTSESESGTESDSDSDSEWEEDKDSMIQAILGRSR